MTTLSNLTMDLNKAIMSLKEEFDAVDVYTQRAETCTDPVLKKIFLHNAKEEKEHAMMVLERIRQNDPELAHEAKDLLFKDQIEIHH